MANNPGSCEEWYLGDERDGVRHGHGAAFYTSGDVYLGQVGGDTGSRGLLLLLMMLALWRWQVGGRGTFLGCQTRSLAALPDMR